MTEGTKERNRVLLNDIHAGKSNLQDLSILAREFSVCKSITFRFLQRPSRTNIYIRMVTYTI